MGLYRGEFRERQNGVAGIIGRTFPISRDGGADRDLPDRRPLRLAPTRGAALSNDLDNAGSGLVIGCGDSLADRSGGLRGSGCEVRGLGARQCLSGCGDSGASRLAVADLILFSGGAVSGFQSAESTYRLSRAAGCLSSASFRRKPPRPIRRARRSCPPVPAGFGKRPRYNRYGWEWMLRSRAGGFP